MVKVKASVARKLGRKRVFRLTKGFYAQKKNRYGQAVRALNKAKRYATAHRRARTGDFRRLWIVRINAACQESGIIYSRFVKGLKEAKIAINRKMLAELAVQYPQEFDKMVKSLI